MHDVPKDLMDQIKQLEDQFTVSTEKLHEVVNRFQSELKKGWFPPLILIADGVFQGLEADERMPKKNRFVEGRRFDCTGSRYSSLANLDE